MARISLTVEQILSVLAETPKRLAALTVDLTPPQLRTAPGPDARTKKVTLTAKARRVVDRLAAEGRATEATIAELEGEIPYPLSRVVTDLRAALHRKSLYDRISDKLATNPAWH